MGIQYISVVTFVNRCRTYLTELYLHVKTILATRIFNFGIGVLKGGSHDRVCELIVDIVSNDARAKGINLTRNDVQYYSFILGLNSARWVLLVF